MLQVKNLIKNYNQQCAVNNVSLKVTQGSIFGLLGPNGAGKSSLLRMVTGITKPDRGEILLNGNTFNLERDSAVIGYMPEERGLYKKMKIGEQAIYLARLKGLSQSEAIKKVDYWFNRLEITNWKSKRVEDLSKGMSQKLQFVITVAHAPKLLILDEPFSGLDPVNSEIIKQEIYQLAKEGTTIIFSTHRMEQVEEICEEIALIHQGKVVLEGNVNQIKQSKKEQFYKLSLNQPLHDFDKGLVSQSGFDYTFKFEYAGDANLLLGHCIQNNYQIASFQEILPTLNEIFIKVVEGNASRQFNSNN